jgi:very-short-patch-repair endonuclease
MNNCLECNTTVTNGVRDFSIANYGIPLCMPHQSWLGEMEKQSTMETIRLYFALKLRGVPAELEKYDGYKHVDIAIEEAKVHIEVDGSHHTYHYKQALSDLKRTFHSFTKGYLTLRIPNALVYNENILNETADYIVEFLNENLKNTSKK